MNLHSRLAKYLWRYSWARKTEQHFTPRAVTSQFDDVRGMTTLEERDFYYQVAKSGSGTGHIADLGCWFGSTTIPLLKGLNDRALNAQGNTRVFAFDRFIWEHFMDNARSWFPDLPALTRGDNFKPYVLANLSNYANLAVVEETNLETYQWQQGPIEILLIDAMKNLPLTVQISRSFLPSVVPQNGVIIFQDFAHHYTAWIHLLTYGLKGILKPLNNVPYSGSMVFGLTRPIVAEDLKFLDSIMTLSTDDINRAFEYSLSLVRPENMCKVIAAKAMCFIFFNNKAEAKRIYAEEIDPLDHNEEEVLQVYEYLK